MLSLHSHRWLCLLLCVNIFSTSFRIIIQHCIRIFLLNIKGWKFVRLIWEMHLFYFFFLFLTFQSHLLWVKWTFRELFHSTNITLTTFLSNASEIWTLAPNEVLAQSKCHLKLTHFISWNLITPDPLHADSEVTRFLEIQYISIHELWILIETVTLVYSCLFFICLPWLQCAWRGCQ